MVVSNFRSKYTKCVYSVICQNFPRFMLLTEYVYSFITRGSGNLNVRLTRRRSTQLKLCNLHKTRIYNVNFGYLIHFMTNMFRFLQ